MESYILRAQRLQNLWKIHSNEIPFNSINFDNETVISGSSLLYIYDLNADWVPNDIDIFTSLSKERFEKVNFVKLVPYHESYLYGTKVYWIEGTKLQVIMCNMSPIEYINKYFDFEFLKCYYNGDIIFYNQNMVNMTLGKVKTLSKKRLPLRLTKYIKRGITVTPKDIRKILGTAYKIIGYTINRYNIVCVTMRIKNEKTHLCSFHVLRMNNDNTIKNYTISNITILEDLDDVGLYKKILKYHKKVDNVKFDSRNEEEILELEEMADSELSDNIIELKISDEEIEEDF